MESSRFAMDAACCRLSLHRNCGRTDLSAGRHGDKGCRPFLRTPFSASGAVPPLRSGQVGARSAN